jgi:hypothetical protein
MISDRRKKSSRANGAKSHGPTTPEGKKRSSQNAIQHGLLAKCLLLPGEDAENFEILMQNHERRFQPADGIELGIIEEMCAAYWRLHRVWTMETHTLTHQISTQPAGQPVVRMMGAFQNHAAQPGTALMQRYETRLQNMYSRAIRTFKLLRTIPVPDLDDDFPDQENEPIAEFPKEPSPIPEHNDPVSPEAAQPSQPTDSEALGSACFTLRGASVPAAGDAPSLIHLPAEPAVPHPAPPPSHKKSGAAV